MAADPHTAPINELTFDDVVAFCSEQRPESIRLEYKEKWSSNSPGRQIAKEICAFANTRGGLLLLGIEEDEENRDHPAPNPQGQELGPNPRQQILHACSSHIYPPLAPDVSELLKNPDNSESGFVVVRVHPSRDVPHTINDGRDIYVRVHDSSEPIRATIDQIDRMLEQRRTLVSLQQARVDSAIEATRRAIGLGRGDAKYLAVAIGPVMPCEPLLDREGCHKILCNPSFASPMSVQSCLDGAYSANAYPERALVQGVLLDVFGNVVVTLCLDAALSTFSASRAQLEGCGHLTLAEKLEGNELSAAHVSWIVEPIPQALKLVDAVCGETGLWGPMRVHVRASGVDRTPAVLARRVQPRVDPRFVAYNPAEPQICFSVDSPSIETNANDLAELLARRLVWAWGGRQPWLGEQGLQDAERRVYGESPCACQRHKRPVHRSQCLECRVKALPTQPTS